MATLPRCWRRRSFTSANIRCGKPRPIWPKPACRCGSIRDMQRPKGSCMSKFTLADLEKRVHERAKASAGSSYTRALLDKGVAHCAKKLGEEAIETAMAAVQEDK